MWLESDVVAGKDETGDMKQVRLEYYREKLLRERIKRQQVVQVVKLASPADSIALIDFCRQLEAERRENLADGHPGADFRLWQAVRNKSEFF